MSQKGCGVSMSTPEQAEHRGRAHDRSLRRELVVLAGVAAVLALLHFADHVVRGALVVDGGLNPEWNHSGWPFNTESDKPYVFPISFIIVFGFLLGGIFFTMRGRLWAGYWLAAGIALNALLAFVHFVGSRGAAETPSVIAMTYRDNLLRIPALIVLAGSFVVFFAVMLQALRMRQRSGHW